MTEKFRIRAGARYVRRDGIVTEPFVRDAFGDLKSPWPYDDDGRWGGSLIENDPRDLVSEYVETPAPAPAARKNRGELAAHVGRLISNDRNATHGDPHVQFAVQQTLMDALDMAAARKLGMTERHALQMITTKLSRIVCGRPVQDHWLDISGYALIAAETAEDPL